MEEEGSVCDAGGRHDGTDVSRGKTGPLELGDGGTHQSFSRLKTLGLTRRGLVYHCHPPTISSISRHAGGALH